MSDFGLDSFALADLESSRTPDPLKIGRDLIAAGKPRSALDVMAEHHQHLADDPEYLILCAQAWQMVGDLPRAQHALLGAIRAAPEDPEPLRLLGEVLIERGEEERAALAFDRAARLRAQSDAESNDEPDVPESGDLIAAAQSNEDSRRSPFISRSALLLVGVLFGVGLLMSGIAALLEPEPVAVVQHSEPTDLDVQPGPSQAIGAVLEARPADESAMPPVPREPNLPPVPRLEEPPASDVALPIAPQPELPAVGEVVAAPKTTTPRSSKRPATSTRRRPKQAAPKLTEAELDAQLAALTDPVELTASGDRLYASGQAGAAARYYRRALELDPDYAPALIGSGRGLLRAERYDEAMSAATRALQLARGVDARPGLEAEAIYQIGRVHHERGDEDIARRLLRQATSMRGVPADAWFYLGEALAQSNSQAAREAYERYLRRRPNGQLAGRARRAIR